jgi:hypothetical protein
MTNPLAIFLGLLVTILIITDIVLTDGLTLLFLARKFTEFTEWMAFWR